MSSLASFLSDAPPPWEVGVQYGGDGAERGGRKSVTLPVVKDAVMSAMVVNAGQRRKMALLNKVAARHRKREIVGRVTAVEERLSMVERTLRGELGGEEDEEEESREPKEFRCKVISGEETQ